MDPALDTTDWFAALIAMGVTGKHRASADDMVPFRYAPSATAGPYAISSKFPWRRWSVIVFAIFPNALSGLGMGSLMTAGLYYYSAKQATQRRLAAQRLWQNLLHEVPWPIKQRGAGRSIEKASGHLVARFDVAPNAKRRQL